MHVFCAKNPVTCDMRTCVLACPELFFCCYFFSPGIFFAIFLARFAISEKISATVNICTDGSLIDASENSLAFGTSGSFFEFLANCLLGVGLVARKEREDFGAYWASCVLVGPAGAGVETLSFFFLFS